MKKVLISDNVAEECRTILEAVDGIEVDMKTGLSPDEFENIIGDYDALVVRSATKVRENAIAKAKKLKVIGRAGAGVDNIDVQKATDAGIIVMNTPGGNTVSTAEHAFALLMSLSRNIPQGDRSIKEGRWDRKKYAGVELRGKTIGIIGLGNIGQVVAKRAGAFQMKVIGYDPFISEELAKTMGIEIVPLDKIWELSDYITLHTPLNESTKHIVNAETLAKCKNGVRIINCARGGIVDETALLEALESGKVAGAALDVYENEPPTDSPIVQHENIVSTPHLGASTAEAQDIVAVMVAEQIRDFLVSGEVRNAVNMPPMAPEMAEQVKPWMQLGKKMGALVGQLGEGQLSGVDITFYGDVQHLSTWPVSSSILEGVFSRSMSEDVNLINAIATAEKLGINVTTTKSSEDMDYRSCVGLTVKTSEKPISVLGTIFGRKDFRIVKFNEYELDFPPEGSLLICGNKDRPGIIGDIGTVMGKNGINIAHMNWARLSRVGDAVVVLNSDEKISRDVVDQVMKINDIRWAKFIQL